MPILAASCSAAPSARLSHGTGSVKLSCTMPSPEVSPYGRMIVFSVAAEVLLDIATSNDLFDEPPDAARRVEGVVGTAGIELLGAFDRISDGAREVGEAEPGLVVRRHVS